MTTFRKILLWLCGVVFGALLLVQDEILGEVAYCGIKCLYPYPLLGSYTFFVAEGIADLLMIIVLVLAFWTGAGSTFQMIVLWLSGVVFGALLLVQEEILGEVAYCGIKCLYPYPLLGAYSFYAAESIDDFFMIVVIVLAFWTGWRSTLKT